VAREREQLVAGYTALLTAVRSGGPN